MTAIPIRCRACGMKFVPPRESIRAGSWRLCPACAPPLAAQHRCRECGRPLRLTSRTLCARSMGVAL
jgi:hypothetical protein